MKVHDVITEQEPQGAPVAPAGAGLRQQSPYGEKTPAAVNRLAGAIQKGASTGVGQSAAVEPTPPQPVSLNFGPVTGAFTYEKVGGGWVETGTKKPVHMTFQQLLNLLNNKKFYNLQRTESGWKNTETGELVDYDLSEWLNGMMKPQPSDQGTDSEPQEPSAGDLPVQTDAGPVTISDIQTAMSNMSADDLRRIRSAIARAQGNI